MRYDSRAAHNDSEGRWEVFETYSDRRHSIHPDQAAAEKERDRLNNLQSDKREWVVSQARTPEELEKLLDLGFEPFAESGKIYHLRMRIREPQIIPGVRL